MPTLHITAGDSAAGSLRQALRQAGRQDGVLPFRDDLSCGPIDPGDPAQRGAWWAQHYDDPQLGQEASAEFTAFWSRVAGAEDRLVVWFSRHAAGEYSFFLAWNERLGDRPYAAIDVTGVPITYHRRDGSVSPPEPARAVGHMPPDSLAALFGTERVLPDATRAADRQTWQRLRAENAPFRIVTDEGPASAPIDCFDAALLARAGSDWRKAARVVGEVMGDLGDPYVQVSDIMLRSRVIALVEAGRLIAEGDPWDLRASRIRLADPTPLRA